LLHSHDASNAVRLSKGTAQLMVKTPVKQALLRSSAMRWLARCQPKGVAILMYHSVVEDLRQIEHSLGGVVHSRHAFEGQMELLARRFSPVDLDQAQKFVTGAAELPDRAVVVTFDDGYTDNLEVAAPILNRLGIPATFYVTVECVQRRTLPWPSRLRYAFHLTSKSRWVDEMERTWHFADPHEREQAYLSACNRFCRLSGDALEAKIAAAEADLDAKLPLSSGELMMTWEQVRKLAQGGHIVGSHTMTHPNLAFLKPEEVRHELTESKRLVEAQIKAPVLHFSYPCPALYPNWTQQTLQETRNVGYRTAATTNNGLVHALDDPLELKRLRPTKTVDGLLWNLESAFAGLAV
jgi:peptidoglycan/xylan/chitin deacetylase (PgdA/CDA1 family)